MAASAISTYLAGATTPVRLGGRLGSSVGAAPGPMRNVTATVPAGSTGTARLSDEMPTTGGPVTGIERSRNDPSGTLGGPFSVVDPPESRFRDFTFLASGTYVLTSRSVNQSVTPWAYGPAVTASVAVGATPAPPPPSSSDAFAVNPMTPGPVPGGTGMVFYAAQDVVDTCGLAVHLVYEGQYRIGGGSGPGCQLFIDRLNYLGINRIRDGWGGNRGGLANWLRYTVRPQISQAGGGLELSMVQPPEFAGTGVTLNSSDAQMLACARALRDIFKAQGDTEYMKWGEGTNETDGQPSQSRRWAQALATAYHEDPATNGTNGRKVYQGTFSPANTTNRDTFSAHGLAPDLDFGTAHDYPGDAFIMNDHIATDFVDYNFDLMVGNKPVIHTETGVTTNRAQQTAYVGVPEEVHNFYCLHLLMELFRRGRYEGPRLNPRVYFYEMLDKNEGENFESRFGMFRYSESAIAPKPGAVTIHNAFLRLKDDGARPAQRRVNLNVTGGNAQTKTAGLLHSDGRVFFLAWQQVRRFDGNNILNPPSVNLTVTLSGTPTSVKLMVPSVSADPTTVSPAATMTFTSRPQEVSWWELTGI